MSQKTFTKKSKKLFKAVKDIAASGALGTDKLRYLKKKKKKDYVTDTDATFGGKKIKKQGPEIKPFKIKQEPLAKNIRPKGLGHKAGGRAGFQHGGRTNLLEELGRVEGEHSNRNRRAEVSRIHGELNKGYSLGGRVGAAKRGFNKKILRKD